MDSKFTVNKNNRFEKKSFCIAQCVKNLPELDLLIILFSQFRLPETFRKRVHIKIICKISQHSDIQCINQRCCVYLLITNCQQIMDLSKSVDTIKYHK